MLVSKTRRRVIKLKEISIIKTMGLTVFFFLFLSQIVLFLKALSGNNENLKSWALVYVISSLCTYPLIIYPWISSDIKKGIKERSDFYDRY